MVDSAEKVVAMESTGESHAIIRALMSCQTDAKGCDIYVSRFPCATCTKMMVQSGISRVYYFPAQYWEMDYTHISQESNKEPVLLPYLPKKNVNDPIFDMTILPIQDMKNSFREKSEKKEANYRSVSRLVTNNPISMSLYIPRWNAESSALPKTNPNSVHYWTLDSSIYSLPSLAHRWEHICAQFNLTQGHIAALVNKYKCDPVSVSLTSPSINVKVMQHAMILAHIVARRTDDPKIGVGTVLVNKYGQYNSIGWNAYPKNATSTDYPQYGADDSLDDETLKYDYILHAEQNALLWRVPGAQLDECVMVSTKMPCDECSPIIHDLRIKTVVTNHQMPKHIDDPTRLRGLTYDKLNKLVENVWIFPG